MLGYEPVPFEMLEDFSRFLAFWLKGMMPSLLLDVLPDDLVRENGNPLATIIRHFAGRSLVVEFKKKEDEKRDLRVRRLR